MSEPIKSAVERYREPKTVVDLAHALEVFFLSEWGMSAGGGVGAAGAEFDLELGDETATVFVLPADQAHALSCLGADRVISESLKLEWVDAAELAVIEAHRANFRAGGEPTSPRPAVERLAPSSN